MIYVVTVGNSASWQRPKNKLIGGRMEREPRSRGEGDEKRDKEQQADSTRLLPFAIHLLPRLVIANAAQNLFNGLWY